MKFIIALIFIIYTNQILADVCTNEIEKYPILANGRVKPLIVHATEVIKYITEKKSISKKGAVYDYCRLSLNKDTELNILIHNKRLKQFLNTDKKSISIFQLLNMSMDLKREAAINKEDNAYVKSINKLVSSIELYKDIIQANNWQIPSFDFNSDGLIKIDVNAKWLPLSALIKRLNETELPYELKHRSNLYTKYMGNSHLIEYYYHKASLPKMALIITLLALISLIILSKDKLAKALTMSTIFIQTLLIILRIIISGRAPITNMYETVMFSGFIALVFAVFMNIFKKEKVFLFAGLSTNILSLMMLNFVPSMVDPSINPLVPVLRDNFWLSTHVTVIIMSYGAFALSWLLANTVLIKSWRGNVNKTMIKKHGQLIYSCIKWGIVLLALGIILGGIWADYSWGRFWGWDPKETWSLIVLCIYIAILHGKYTSLINDRRFLLLSAYAFLSVIMAWFGVNYILATGLHSYGFSEGGAIFIISFVLIQVIICIISTFKTKNII